MTGRSAGECAWRALPSAFAAGGAGRRACQAIYAVASGPLCRGSARHAFGKTR